MHSHTQIRPRSSCRFQEHVKQLNMVTKPVLGTQYDDPRRCRSPMPCCAVRVVLCMLRVPPCCVLRAPSRDRSTPHGAGPFPPRSKHPLASVQASAEALRDAAREFRRRTGTRPCIRRLEGLTACGRAGGRAPALPAPLHGVEPSALPRRCWLRSCVPPQHARPPFLARSPLCAGHRQHRPHVPQRGRRKGAGSHG